MKSIGRQAVSLLLTLLIISFLSFTAFSVIPGNAAISSLGTDATQEEIEALKEKMGLNGPLLSRYGRWLSGAVRGDFGESLSYPGTSVASLLQSRLSSTLLLAVLALIMIVLFSFPLSLLQVHFRGKALDHIIGGVSQVLMAVPSFFMGIFLTFLFGLVFHLFSPGNYVHPEENFWKSAAYLFYPALTVALPKTAMMVRFLTGSILAQSTQDYVRTARSTGESRRTAISRHVLRGALIPVITFLGLMTAEIMAGSIVAEQVFSVPGIGRLLITSVSDRDFPVVQAIVLYITTIVVTINFIVDLLYRLIDPRIRTQMSKARRGRFTAEKEAQS